MLSNDNNFNIQYSASFLLFLEPLETLNNSSIVLLLLLLSFYNKARFDDLPETTRSINDEIAGNHTPKSIFQEYSDVLILYTLCQPFPNAKLEET